MSASRTGSLDKSVLEAMASGRPILISNPSFRTELVGQEELLMFREGDAGHLGEQLERLVALDNEKLEALGRRLARRIVGRHDLKGFVRRLASAFDHLSSSKVR